MRRGFGLALTILVLGAGPVAAADSFEPNDTQAEAFGPILSDQVVVSYISTATDVDWYFVDADSGDLRITLTDVPPGIDYDLSLIDANGALLALSDSSGNQDEQILVLNGASARFWILVDAPLAGLGQFSATEPYRMTATFNAQNIPPSVTLLTPDGGEVWPVGSSREITWSASDPEDADTVAISVDLSLDDGATWTSIAEDLDNSGAFAWTVPDTPSETARVRVRAVDRDGASTADTSAAPFRITANQPPTVTLLAPTGGEAWIAGDTETILWSADDDGGAAALRIGIEFRAGGNGAWTALGTDLENSGSFNWPVSATVTDSGRVRVTAVDGGGATASDTTAGLFSIHSTPLGQALLTLESGITLGAGTTGDVAISVNHDQPFSAIRLLLGFDPGHLAARTASAATRAATLPVSVDIDQPGRIEVTLGPSAGTTVAAGSGPVATVRFLARFGFSGVDSLRVIEATVLDPDERPMTLHATGTAVALVDFEAGVTLALNGPGNTAPGDTIEVPVPMSANLDLGALRFDLAYDPGVLAPMAVEQGPRTAGMTLASDTTATGRIGLLFYYPAGGILPPGDGRACTIRFRVAADAPGNTDLRFGTTEASTPEGLLVPVTAAGDSLTPAEPTLTAEAAVGGVRLGWTRPPEAAWSAIRILRAAADDSSPHLLAVLSPDADSYTDSNATPASVFRYWLEVLDRLGGVRRYGPVEGSVAAAGLRVGMPYPNPGAGNLTWPVAGISVGARVEVLDTAGRLVRRLSPAGRGVVLWDGRGADGRRVPAGVYFLRLRDGDASAVRRIIRLAR